jgi:hypothetical protein
MHAIVLHSDRSVTSVKAKFAVHAAFLLLFPGFFFYHTLLGLGVIGPVLGGYFTFVALAVTLPLVWCYVLTAKRDKNYFLITDFYLALFALYYSLVVAANSVGGANPVIVQKYVASMIYCMDIYIIFRMIDFNDRMFIVLAALSLALMSGITMYFSIDGFFFLRNLDEATNPESVATYQGFARSYIYTFLIVVSVIKPIAGRFLLYGLATISLFLNGARSEFSAVLFVVPIIEFYYSRHKLYSVFLVFFLLICLAVNAESIVDMLPDNRILQLFDVSRSSSGVAREQLSREAWHTITENPIFGDFASYADGYYAHNILCAWVDFGLVGLVFLSSLLIWPAVRLLGDGYFLQKKSADFVVACSFVSIAILWALMAKSVPDMSAGAALGAFAKYRYARQGQNRLPYSRPSMGTLIGRT